MPGDNGLGCDFRNDGANGMKLGTQERAWGGAERLFWTEQGEQAHGGAEHGSGHTVWGASTGRAILANERCLELKNCRLYRKRSCFGTNIWGKSGVRGVGVILVPMLGITCHIGSLKSLYRKRAVFDTNFLGPSEENAGTEISFKKV